jgi:hypothetical protein
MTGNSNKSLIMSDAASIRLRISNRLGQGLLLLITSLSTFAVFFIFYFILKDVIYMVEADIVRHQSDA